MDVNKIFSDAGFTKSGGIWGDNQWKKINNELAVGVGGSDENDEHLLSPTHAAQRCHVTVFRGPRISHWSVTEGEVPDCIGNFDTGFADYEFDNVTEAIGFIRKLK